MKRGTAFVLFLGLIASLVSQCAPKPAPNERNPELHALFEEAWAFELEEDPLLATRTGYKAFNDRLPSVTVDDQERRAAFRRKTLERLSEIDDSGLGAEDRISYDMFERQLRDRLADFEFRGYLLPLTVDTGFHIGFARLANRMPFAAVKDYENYIARLRGFPEYVQQHIELLREGLEIGMTLPRVVLEGYEITIESHIVEDPTESVFYPPFESFPSTVAPAKHEQLREAGRAAIMEGAVRGYREFLQFMVDEYIPNARATLGASELPNGRDYYAHLIRHFTTLDIDPDEVHEIGLGEVARIRAEMMAVIAEVGFTGGFDAFLEFLRTDPRFYAKTPHELLKEASFIAKRMDAKLPSLFKTLPRLPYGVAPVPDHLAPKYTAGRYIGAPIGSTEPGYYWVNTYALESRPLYTLEALTLHEAVPGHHLQNALRLELEDLPSFRRFAGIGAFGEGWGLYSERLGLEAGFYTDPYRNFGRLTYEMWRACRLVVDTGIHAKGWTRPQTLDYLATNTALSIHEIRTETDRYISWPGQALAYKLGELKIRELRHEAEETLGERFDIRLFHDAVLLHGPVPLPVLETQVRAYIETELGRQAAGY
jgi:uncharacterized protein (DUF885 family)